MPFAKGWLSLLALRCEAKGPPNVDMDAEAEFCEGPNGVMAGGPVAGGAWKGFVLALSAVVPNGLLLLGAPFPLFPKGVDAVGCHDGAVAAFPNEDAVGAGEENEPPANGLLGAAALLFPKPGAAVPLNGLLEAGGVAACCGCCVAPNGFDPKPAIGGLLGGEFPKTGAGEAKAVPNDPPDKAGAGAPPPKGPPAGGAPKGLFVLLLVEPNPPKPAMMMSTTGMVRCRRAYLRYSGNNTNNRAHLVSSNVLLLVGGVSVYCVLYTRPSSVQRIAP